MNKPTNATLSKKHAISPLWVLPFLALCMVIYLGYKAYIESGVRIQVTFPNATGMQVGKTLVKYQGLTVGTVTDIDINQDLTSVDVFITIDHQASDLVKEGSKFWMVAPKASITGVEGLDALFSGNYIAVKPGEGSRQDKFVALERAPALLPGEDGLSLTLIAASLHGLTVGSPILFNELQVGHITRYQLNSNNNIELEVFIEDSYRHLVKENSRFYNSSGIDVKASLHAGLEVKSQGLLSMLAGGVAFTSPTDSAVAQDGDIFSLYASFDKSFVGQSIQLTANSDEITLQKGMGIHYRGQRIGVLTAIELNDVGVLASADIFRPYDQLITSDSYFWLEGATFNKEGLSHASRLITGAEIEFMPGKSKEPAVQFPLTTVPAKARNNQEIEFSADSAFNLSEGAPITYASFTIGHISQISLSADFSHVDFKAQIYPEFGKLLDKRYYFVLKPAAAINASIDGIKVSSPNLSNLLSGEIALAHHRQADNSRLYADHNQASALIERANYTQYTLTSDIHPKFSEGVPVLYQAQTIGEVTSISRNLAANRSDIVLAIAPKYQALIKKGGLFYQQSAINVDASLRGIKVDIAPMSALVKGGITFINEPNSTKAEQKRLYTNERSARLRHQMVEIQFSSQASIDVGAQLRYQGQVVGEVMEVSLSDDLNMLQVKAGLHGRYAKHFMKEGVSFVLKTPKASLAGIENLDAVISGNFIQLYLGDNNGQPAHQFTGLLSPVHQIPSQGKVITLSHSNGFSLNIGHRLFYRGMPIGTVLNKTLSDDANQVQFTLHIEEAHQHLINDSSKFWLLSGVNIDWGLFSGASVRAGSIETILSGGVGVATEQNSQQTQSRFPLFDELDPDWLNWQPKLFRTKDAQAKNQ